MMKCYNRMHMVNEMKKLLLVSLLMASASIALAESDFAEKTPNEGGTPTETVERLQQAFADLDTEGNGYLSRDIMAERLGITGERFTHLDEDGDGVINRQEFLTLSLEGEAKGTKGAEENTPKPMPGPLNRNGQPDDEPHPNVQPHDRAQ